MSQLSTQIPDLIRSEIRLAQAEVAEKGKRAGIGIGMFSVAGLLGFFGFAVLLATFVLLLDLVLPAWAAALIVAVVALRGRRRRRARRARTRSPRSAPRRPSGRSSGIKQDVATVKGERR